MARAERWAMAKDAVRLTAITRSHDSSGMSRKGSCVHAAAFEMATSRCPAPSSPIRTASSQPSMVARSTHAVVTAAPTASTSPRALSRRSCEPIHEHDVRSALVREPQRRGTTEAAPSAGDQDMSSCMPRAIHAQLP